MKKKIVYISGADVFDINDVRAAFDEVRNTLNLDSDTILFGVPVDNDSEMATPQGIATESVTAAIDDTVCTDGKVEPVTEECLDEDFVEEVEEVPCDEQENESVEEVNEKTDSNDDAAPVVPISSVLVSNKEESVSKSKKKPKTPIAIKEEVVKTIAVQEDEITDMLNDDVPSEPAEKTLEELLESMEPLREDVQPDAPVELSQNNDEEIDATLESLASEFADNQSKIPATKKSSGRGKIGKLKNILPFKKMRRDDTGLMGDLFGWAGIAANDEDFTIPGFFTNAAGKK